MPIPPAKANSKRLEKMPAFLSAIMLHRAGSDLLRGISPSQNADRQNANPGVRVEFPEADVLKAVQEVTQDQIIHGTYSYDKERILYGAHSANSARVFGGWPGPGKAFYKVADKVLSPRFFKDSEDIGTISVRYVVQDAGPGAAILRIDAVFVDARNVRHPSEGNVESSEFAAIQEHLKNIQASRQQSRRQRRADYGPTRSSRALQPPAGIAVLGARQRLLHAGA